MAAVPTHAPAVPRFARLFRSMPDARLVARVRGGDERAFEAVFDRYHRQLLGFCRHMLGNREEAEDAVQHVFVSAHRHLVSGDDRVVELRPWLYAIARNRCLSLLRTRRESVNLDDVAEPTGDGLALAQEVEQREDLKGVLADLARLPDEQRAALVLSELGALSHEEVADVLGVRRDKVKALVFQARESLAGWRQARDTDCSEIREQLATLTGGALRRGALRKHLDTCDGCRIFRGEVRRQREAMALLLPVVPSVALKAKVVGAVAAGGNLLPGAGLTAGAGLAGTAALPAAGGSIAALGSGLAGKALVVAAIAGGAGGYAVVDQVAAPEPTPATRIAAPTPASATALPTPVEASLVRNGNADFADRGEGTRDGAKGKRGNGGARRENRGRPAVPGANGFDNAPKAQGLARRATAVPSHGAKARRGGSTRSERAPSKAREPARRQQAPAAARPAKPVKPAASKAQPAAPVAGAPVGDEPAAVSDETSEEPATRVDRGKPALDGIVGAPAE